MPRGSGRCGAKQGIPPHLLAAISRVESGRRDPVTGDWHPWPWTLDIEGEGTFTNTKAQAVAADLGRQARGVQSIDVGCGQINLLHHPNAFASLDIALDPQANANVCRRIPQRAVWPIPETGTRPQQRTIGNTGRSVPNTAQGACGVAAGDTTCRRILAVGIATVPILGHDIGRLLHLAALQCLHAQTSGMGAPSENDHATSPNWRNSPRGAQPGCLPVGADRTRVATADDGEPGCNQ